jgi:signal transduction histidine kinase
MYATWINLNRIDDMVSSGEIVTELFDTALEIRRFEKNYFLYGSTENFNELLGYIEKFRTILIRDNRQILLFSDKGQISKLRQQLEKYREMLLQGRNFKESQLDRWEEGMRVLGRDIVNDAKIIKQSEKEVLQLTLNRARKSIIVIITVIFILTSVGAVVFYQMLIRPLKKLEMHMGHVAEGVFSPIKIKFTDSEFVSLNNAFNRMLHELEERKSYLVESEKLASLGTMLFGVAHELNNPISNISTSTQILKEELEQGDMEFKRQIIDQIEDGVERASRIVGSLLDYSRTGTKELINCKVVIEEAIRFIKGDLPKKVAISLNVSSNIQISAEKQKIQQVFLNLIKNAVDSIKDEGDISIYGRTISDDEDNKIVRLIVKDSGSGMDDAMMSKVFNPFFTTKGAKSGHGLGLFIVHNIIKEHYGRITVNSAPGFGTSFMIELPMEA